VFRFREGREGARSPVTHAWLFEFVLHYVCAAAALNSLSSEFPEFVPVV